MHSLRKKALLVVVLGAAAAQLTLGAVTSQASPPCSAGSSCSPDAPDALQVTVPEGSQPCPASGLGASCLTSAGGAVTPGTSSTPDGESPCPPTAFLSTPAACSEPLATTPAPPPDPAVEPSIPVASVRPATPGGAVTLTSSARAVVSGGSVVLTATAMPGAIGAGSELEIFDVTTGTLAGACGQGTRCAVAYTADAGVHVFRAVLPTGAESTPLSVGWVSVGLATTLSAVGPGRGAILTATSSVPVEQFGYTIQLLDTSREAPLTFCSRGTNCSAAVTDPASGTHDFAAAVGPAGSQHVSVTWLTVALSGVAYRAGGPIRLDASTNVDLTATPWSLGIVDERGRLVGTPCKTGATCSAEVATTSDSSSGQFSAVVGALPTVRGTPASAATSLVDVQAQSALMKPARLLWGVDSCKAITGDPTGEVYPKVARGLGAPDFWGRYLTPTMCAAISGSEVALAHNQGMAILPIYNDYDCSNVAGYDTAVAYAHAASAAAQSLQIPQGRAVAIDIEPPGPYCSGAVDAAFVQGWFDAITAAGYVPLYYGNGTSGSEFASAYCAAETQNPTIATGSYIWSFEPSLDAPGLSKAGSPGWGPYVTGCPDSVVAWQYQIDVNSPNPDVDLDEALSSLPLWYP